MLQFGMDGQLNVLYRAMTVALRRIRRRVMEEDVPSCLFLNLYYPTAMDIERAISRSGLSVIEFESRNEDLVEKGAAQITTFARGFLASHFDAVLGKRQAEDVFGEFEKLIGSNPDAAQGAWHRAIICLEKPA